MLPSPEQQTEHMIIPCSMKVVCDRQPSEKLRFPEVDLEPYNMIEIHNT